MQGISVNTRFKYGIIILTFIVLACIPEQMMLMTDYPVCIFRTITGKMCPFCGMTHAVYYLQHFSLHKALLYNPLVCLIPVLLLIEIFNDIYGSTVTKNIRLFTLIMSLAAFLVLFLIRML